jgi:hypothetical protein
MSAPAPSYEVVSQSFVDHAKVCNEHFPFVGFTCPCDDLWVFACVLCDDAILVHRQYPSAPPCEHTDQLFKTPLGMNVRGWVLQIWGVLR